MLNKFSKMILEKVQTLKETFLFPAIQKAQGRILYYTEYLWVRRKKIAFWAFILMLVWKKDIGWEVNSPDLNYKTFLTNAKDLGKSEFSIFSIEESTPIFISDKYEGQEQTKNKSTKRGSIWDSYAKPVAQKVTRTSKQTKTTAAAQKGNNLANTFTNLTFIADDPNASKKNKAFARKKLKQLAYINRFAKTAQTEMEKFSIPASITLAQGLLESNVGESRLATQNNNHFGIKCFSRKCKKGHCANYTDDSHKDFFRKYKSTWESFRAHSKLLQAKRYRPLYKLDKNDYKGWAHGLKKSGYATDKKYAYKIIQLIEDLGLDAYDS
ncbi:MAG: flagellum-specific peptidoglycan hydrolase FlgJ [Saprospiraceae bacterium]